jgi:hypothetical protein
VAFFCLEGTIANLKRTNCGLSGNIVGVEMNWIKRGLIGCFVTGSILILLLVAGLLWAVFSWEDEFLFSSRHNAYITAETFTLALMQNRVETAKLRTDSSEWPYIDAWLSTHEAVYCPTPRGFTEEPTWWSVGSKKSDDGTEYHLPVLILALPCPTQETTYHLTIEDISMRQTEDGWLITEWGEITESR